MKPSQAALLMGVRHVVHDYANLVSAGSMKLSDRHAGKALEPPVNTHVGEAFLMNCRKMYEFFVYDHKKDYIRASLYLKQTVKFKLASWALWHEAMSNQLLHLTLARASRPKVWEGHNENRLFLDEFRSAWQLMLRNLKDEFKTEFEAQIAAGLNSEYAGLDLR
jgi:hypothetical protein